MPGARVRSRGRTIAEKDITLAIAKRLQRALESRGTRVVMTRSADQNVPLPDRSRIANEVGADVFVSIHNDSYGKADSISGTTSYFHADKAEGRRLAQCIERHIAAVSGIHDRGAVSDTRSDYAGRAVRGWLPE